MIKLFSTCICLLIIVSPLTAQKVDDGAAAAVKTMQQNDNTYLMSILYLSDSQESEINRGFSLFFRNEETDFRINTIPGALTRTISYKGPPKFMFFEPQTNAEGEIIRIPLVNLDLGKPGRKLIFMNRSVDNKISARVMHVGVDGFPAGTVRVMNFSKQPAVVKVDEKRAKLGSMSAEDFSIKSDKPRFRVRLAMAGFNGEETYLFENKKMAMQQGSRELLLLHISPRDQSKLTYTSFAIRDMPFQSNYSDDKIKKGDGGYRDAYVPTRYRE